MLKYLTLGTGLLLLLAPELPTQATLPPVPIQVAKKKKKPAAVVVTEAQITQEDIAGTLYYTLSGRLKNRSDEPVLNPLVYYEVYEEGTGKIVTGGSLLVQPSVIPGNSEATFQSEINFAGRVRITLVEWLTRENKPKTHDQQEFFPRNTEATDSDRS